MKKILIASDDNILLGSMKETFVKAGFAVETAETGAIALEKFNSTTPDLLITDLVMETFDAGFLLSYRIKKLKAEFPIIMISGINQDSHLNFELEEKNKKWMNVDAFYNKPVNMTNLIEKVKGFLHIKTSKAHAH